MIVYLDTSSLVKLYVREDGTENVRALVAGAALVATSVIAYAEARSALARRRRERSFTRGEHARIKDALDRDWASYLALDVTQPIARHAGDLAELHELRAFDGIHLASYRSVAAAISDQPVVFSSFDERLSAAAAAASA